MWYLAWILGVLLAASFAILNALWLEASGTSDSLSRVASDEPLNQFMHKWGRMS